MSHRDNTREEPTKRAGRASADRAGARDGAPPTLPALLLGLLLLLGTAQAQTPRAVAPPSAGWKPADAAAAQVAAAPQAAVVRVLGNAGAGSGTLVAAEEGQGIVVTCQHVVAGSSQWSVVYPRGGSSSARLIDADAGLDLAALWVAVPEGVEPVHVAASAPGIGEAVTVCGYGGGAWRARDRQVQGFPRRAWQSTPDQIAVTGQTISGDSGGPILTADGELAGVLWGGPLAGPSGPMLATHGANAVAVISFLERKTQCQFPWCRPPGPRRPPIATAPSARPPSVTPAPAPAAGAADLAALRQAISEQAKQITRLSELMAALQLAPGPPGPIGPTGRAGPAGARGPAGAAAVIDHAELARRIVTLLPPVVVQTINERGDVLQQTETPLGAPVRLQLVPVGGAR